MNNRYVMWGKKHTRLTISLLVLLTVCSARAEMPYDAIFLQAMAAFPADYRKSWSFTEKRVVNGVATVGHYDPRSEPGWRLLTVDQRQPTDEETEAYLKEKATEATRSDSRTDPDQMIRPDSLELLEETSDYWLFDFVPTGKGDNADFMKHMDGALRISKAGPIVEFIDIRSREAFKPRFGFKVNDFLTRMEFVEQSGAVLPYRLEFRIDAKAMGLMNIDQKVSVQYTDYQNILTPATDTD
ncbi:MAG: hypothetical protein O2780_17615 [Proteobacteria bacterium]|nr:hypothetical protein [Pseudomonadota bacterium]MDA1301430.1 hypothetical protein [Pseudomonadota bacterium]